LIFPRREKINFYIFIIKGSSPLAGFGAALQGFYFPAAGSVIRQRRLRRGRVRIVRRGNRGGNATEKKLTM
jgi:hypothetical protein